MSSEQQHIEAAAHAQAAAEAAAAHHATLDGGGGGGDGGGGGGHGEARDLDRFLPIANISRIMKKALPQNAKIAKDSKETVQECVSEFISFITSEASDKCQQEKRKTINGEDVLYAMSSLGFDSYVEPLKMYLHKYREGEKATPQHKDARLPQSKKDGFHDPQQHHMLYAQPPFLPQQIMPPFVLQQQHQMHHQLPPNYADDAAQAGLDLTGVHQHQHQHQQ